MNATLFLLILATYRLALLVTWDELFKPVRNYFGTHSNDFIREKLGYFIHCPYCLGLWIALFLAIIYYPESWPLMTFAIAGGQAFLQGITEK